MGDKCDVKSEVDALLRTVHGAPPKPAAVRFDADRFRRLLDASAAERMPDTTALGRSAFFVCEAAVDLAQVAAGIAAASGHDAVVFELAGATLRRGEPWQLLEPLTRGRVVVLWDRTDSEVATRLAAYWPRFCAAPPGGFGAAVTAKLMLDGRLPHDNPGAVVALRAGFPQSLPDWLDAWPLREADARELAALGAKAPAAAAPLRLGVSAPAPAWHGHEGAWREYRALTTALRQAGHGARQARRLLRRTLDGRDAASLEPDWLYEGVEPALYRSLEDRLEALARHCRGIEGGFDMHEEVDDCYAAAIVIERTWERASDASLLYRGQADETWTIVPSYFRNKPDAAERRERERRLRCFVALLRDALAATVHLPWAPRPAWAPRSMSRARPRRQPGWSMSRGSAGRAVLRHQRPPPRQVRRRGSHRRR